MIKIEVNAKRFNDMFDDYPGGYKVFLCGYQKIFSIRDVLHTPRDSL
jgi:hypothetical protein